MIAKPRAWVTRHRTAVLITSISLISIGLMITGFAAGQLLLPKTVVSDAYEAPTAEPAGADVETVAPDLFGLDETTARRVIADAGLTADVVTTARPFAAVTGSVIDQRPAPGSVITPAELTTFELVIAEPLAVPSIRGASERDARNTLEALGATVVVTRVVEPSAPEGTVIDSAPTEGEPMGPTIELIVSDAGGSVRLAALSPVERDGCSSISRGTVNGLDFGESIACRTSPDDIAFAEWTLARRAVLVTGTLGLLDTGSTGTVTVRVTGDERVLVEHRVGFGQTVPLDVDVRGILRLRIEATGSASRPTLVLADALVRAMPEQLEAIENGG